MAGVRRSALWSAMGLLCLTVGALAWNMLSMREQLLRVQDEADFFRRAWILKVGKARKSAEQFAVWQDLYDTWTPPVFAWTEPARRRQDIDVLVIGGNPGGIAAAIAAARLGARVTLTDEHPWVGGVWTVEGVSVPDEVGRHVPPDTKGIVGEFQRRVWRCYRDDLVSNRLSSWPFLPWDGARILADMLSEAKVDVRVGTRFLEPIMRDREIIGARFQSGKRALELRAPRVVDATWNGDVAVSCGCRCSSGRECRAETGEVWAPREPDNRENCITYVLIVRDTGRRVAPPQRPPGYDPDRYGPGVQWYTPDDSAHPSLYQYGLLPRKHVMINWPDYGNDLEVRGYCCAPPAERQRIEREAKNLALGFWYYLKTDRNYARDTRNWALARDFGTPDRLPFSPYHRTGRRIRCEYILNAHDIVPRCEYPQASEPPPTVFDDIVALGDYPIDTHGDWPNRPKVAQRFFSIPYRSLVPRSVDGLVIGDMAIGSTFLAQSAIRLQPTRMRIGQAAGVAAAASLKLGVEPRELDPGVVRTLLLRQNASIYPPAAFATKR
ncbi:MAG: FAD-dependent oxidoreductase [Armatimonadota bacterium]|nr:MAG: FAD-dependent oxidoreductase [Armatimonadota bacterium]